MPEPMTWTILEGDVLAQLRTLPDNIHSATVSLAPGVVQRSLFQDP